MPESLIHKYYQDSPQLEALLLRHSRQVADMALRLCGEHPEWNVDEQFVEEAALLHDIGIIRCNAPGIYCYGTKPYISHGLIGAEILRSEGLPRHARVAERHTGSGLDLTQAQALGCNHDLLPETIEEKVICYADKFFSKSHPDRVATPEHIREQMARFGEDSLQRWLDLEKMMK